MLRPSCLVIRILQQAQPTTLAHYLKAVIDQLTRDFKRLQAAYNTINRSSMGAAALTTTGFTISRERMAQFLAFDDMIENAWDAVAGADYIAEACKCCATCRAKSRPYIARLSYNGQLRNLMRLN